MAEHSTIYDVASRAGVSISTVSHTLNRPDRVNVDTRRRVLEAIDELGYIPKATAVAHARKALGRVGVLAPFTSFASYTQRLMGVLKEARNQPTEIAVFDQESAASASSPLLNSLPVTRRLDGLLIMGLPLDDALAARLLSQGLPTVLVDSTRPELDSIVIDDHAAGFMVGQHLLGRGRRRIAYVSQFPRSTAYLSQGQQRRAGVEKALGEAGLEPALLRRVATSNDIAGGRAALQGMLARDELPDAVFAHHDLLAAGVLAECQARGVRVPDDLAIVGFDDTELAEAMDLTTVRQPLEESGRLGFRQLGELMRNEQVAPRQVTLGVSLVARATS